MSRKICILQVSKLYYPWIGGIESVIQNTSEGLKDLADVRVLVCSPKGKGSAEEINGIKVIRAGSLGMFFSMPVSITFPFILHRMSRRADVIILHDPFPLGDLAVLLSGFRGKVIVWWHSDIIKQKKLLKIIDPFIHALLRRADAIFTTTQGYIGGSAYISKYREKCRIVPYGLRLQEYLQAELTPILTQAACDKSLIKVLFVGRLVYYKGADVLLKAFSGISGAELFIVGTGADMEALRQKVSGMNSKVHFMGNLSDKDLKSAFADCDIFVLPSIEKSEAFGIVQLEAMIYGKPVINTDLKTSVPYVSIHGETGLTVRAGDPEALKKAIITLIRRADLRAEYGANARQRVIGNFDIDKTCKKILNEIKNI